MISTSQPKAPKGSTQMKPTPVQPVARTNSFAAAVANQKAAEDAKYASIPILDTKTLPASRLGELQGAVDRIDPLALPPDLEHISILGQGPKGSMKSSLFVGNQRAVILAPPDGKPVPFRARAHIIRIDHYAYTPSLDSTKDRSFEGNVKRWLDYAYKVGENGALECTMVFDSVYEIVQWLMKRELEKLNADIDQRNEWGRGAKGDNWVPIRRLDSIRDDDESNMTIFPKLGEEIADYGREFRGAGWGFGCAMHLQLGYNYQNKVSEDKPDIPGSASRALDKPADMVLTSTKIGDGKDAPVSFNVATRSARVPMPANILIPNSADLPAHLTAWDIIRAEYEPGRKAAVARQEAFLAADAKANTSVVKGGTVK